MTNGSVGLKDLISHRFRGFAKHENTIQGLRSALDFGVLKLEFDVRMAACGTPLVYHDEAALDQNNQLRNICECKASTMDGLGGAFARMPKLETILKTASDHFNADAMLLIDIKDLGFEREIHSLVSLYRLQHRTIFVSWLPDVLFRLHDFAPDIPKIFSHWNQPANADDQVRHHVHVSNDGNIGRSNKEYILGIRSGWSITTPIGGKCSAS